MISLTAQGVMMILLMACALWAPPINDLPVAARAAALGIEWIALPGGPVTLGDDLLAPPEIKLAVAPFEISKTEVTVAQYRACLDAGICEKNRRLWRHLVDRHDLRLASHCNINASDRARHPINCVAFYQALEFAAWIDARLPTEVEWVYVVRGREASPGSAWRRLSCREAIMDDEEAIDSFGQQAPGCGAYGTWPVCSKPKGATIDGLCDTIGNVWEWTFGAPDLRQSVKMHSMVTQGYFEGIWQRWADPSHPYSQPAVIRGGGWEARHSRFEPSQREIIYDSDTRLDVGFRVVRLKPSESTR